MYDFFKLNDWPIKKFFLVIAILNALFLSLFFVEFFLDLKLWIFREFLGFFIFAFLPGFLFLRILRLHNLDTVDAIVYSFGLSLSYEMILGVFINIFYPFFGIRSPISTLPVIITIIMSILMLCIICYIRDKNFIGHSTKQNIDWKFLRSLGYFLFIPFLSIFGSYLFNYYSENIVLLIMLAGISIIPGLVIFDKIDVGDYPIAIWAVSLSLVFYGTLNYPNLFFDTGWEYYLANLVKTRGFWDPDFPPVRNNSVLYSVILHPLLSIFCNIDLFSTYKIVNPILCSFTPLILYSIFNKQTNDEKISFLSTILVIFMFIFYIWFAPNSRQAGGFLFLALIVLLISDTSIDQINKKILLLIFTFSLIVSHYGTSYLFMYLLLGTFLVCNIRKFIFIEKSNITSNYIMLFITSALGYYLYTSSSAPLDAALRFFKDTFTIISHEIFTPKSVIVSSYTLKWPLSVRVSRDILSVTFIFIGVGLVDQILKKYRYNNNVTFHDEYIILASLSLLIYIIVSINPDFGRGRTIVLGYVFLAPFFFAGFRRSWDSFRRVCKLLFRTINNRNYEIFFKVILCIYFVVYLLFPSGFVSETITHGYGDYSPVVFINKDYACKIKNPNDIKDPYFLRAFYRIYARDDEIASGQWLSKNWNAKSDVYVESSGRVGELTLVPYMYLNKEGEKPFVRIIMTDPVVTEKSYVYLRYFNYVIGITFKNIPTEYYGVNKTWVYTKNKIYDNKGSAILYT